MPGPTRACAGVEAARPTLLSVTPHESRRLARSDFTEMAHVFGQLPEQLSVLANGAIAGDGGLRTRLMQRKGRVLAQRQITPDTVDLIAQYL